MQVRTLDPDAARTEAPLSIAANNSWFVFPAKAGIQTSGLGSHAHALDPRVRGHDADE